MAVWRPAIWLLATGLLLALPAKADTILTAALQLPLRNHLGKNLQAFGALLEERSGGELQVRIFPSAQLFRDKEIPQAVSMHAVDLGVASAASLAGPIPVMDVFNVPFLFDGQAHVARALQPGARVRTLLEAAAAQKGLHVLWWQAFGGVHFLSKGPNPIRLPTDVTGRTVRVFGRTIGDTIETLGGAATFISGSEQFLAYMRGTVDAGLTGLSSVKSRSLYRAMDAVTLTDHADVEFIVLMQEAHWQSLPAETRALLEGAAREVEASLRHTITALDADAVSFLRGEMQVIELTDEERGAWREATKPVLGQFLARTGPDGRALVDAVAAAREQD